MNTELDICCICLDPMNEYQELSWLVCGHGFHSECVFIIRNTCPLCRSELVWLDDNSITGRESNKDNWKCMNFQNEHCILF